MSPRASKVCPSSKVLRLDAPLVPWLCSVAASVLWAPSLFSLCSLPRLPFASQTAVHLGPRAHQHLWLGLCCSLQAVLLSPTSFCSKLPQVTPQSTAWPLCWIVPMLPSEHQQQELCLVTKAWSKVTLPQRSLLSALQQPTAPGWRGHANNEYWLCLLYLHNSDWFCNHEHEHETSSTQQRQGSKGDKKGSWENILLGVPPKSCFSDYINSMCI